MEVRLTGDPGWRKGLASCVRRRLRQSDWRPRALVDGFTEVMPGGDSHDVNPVFTASRGLRRPRPNA